MTLQTHDAEPVQKLMAMGILPGSSMRIDRTFATFVFTGGYRQFAVDAGTADLIQAQSRDQDSGRESTGKSLRFLPSL